MGKRQIKKTVVRYEQTGQTLKGEDKNDDRQNRERSRQKQGSKGTHKELQVKVQQTNVNSRRARLQAMRKARQQQEVLLETNQEPKQIQVKIQEPYSSNDFAKQASANHRVTPQPQKQRQEEHQTAKRQQHSQPSEASQEEGEERTKVIRKPVFIARSYRDQDDDQDQIKQQERKKKNARYTTKMLLQQQRYQDSEEENELTDSQNENNPDGINDDDTADEELQFELWKIRELNRIRRALQERRKHEVEKAEIQRRRQMTNQAILLENKELGSDATSGETQTRYAYMQKYYHKGAFYQDSEDQIFKRDYNLPTPMEMQDKTLLPAILQKRVGNFGKKGQSKYTHLTAEDTSDLNPLTRPDESLLEYWKRRTAGYKGSSNKNV